MRTFALLEASVFFGLSADVSWIRSNDRSADKTAVDCAAGGKQSAYHNIPSKAPRCQMQVSLTMRMGARAGSAKRIIAPRVSETTAPSVTPV